MLNVHPNAVTARMRLFYRGVREHRREDHAFLTR